MKREARALSPRQADQSGAHRPRGSSPADVTVQGGGSVTCPGKAFRASRQQKAPEEQMFLFKADGNGRTTFLPLGFSRGRGSCLPRTQTRILMRLVAEPGLRDGGLTNTRMRLLRNAGRGLAAGQFYIVWRRNELFSGMQFDIFKGIINGNCQFSLISARDCCSV